MDVYTDQTLFGERGLDFLKIVKISHFPQLYRYMVGIALVVFFII